MKIICIDNFNRDHINDTLICENVNNFYGEMFVNLLNEKLKEESKEYYKLVNDDYELYKNIIIMFNKKENNQ